MSATPFKLPDVESCYYCEILNSDGHPAVIQAFGAAVAIVNPRQFQEGQIVVVPRRHAPTLLDLTDEEALDVISTARRMAPAIVEAFEMDGLLLYQNNGVASGQEVPHFHLHLVPQRFASSRWGNEPPQVADALGRAFEPQEPIWLDESQLAAVASRIKVALARVG